MGSSGAGDLRCLTQAEFPERIAERAREVSELHAELARTRASLEESCAALVSEEMWASFHIEVCEEAWRELIKARLAIYRLRARPAIPGLRYRGLSRPIARCLPGKCTSGGSGLGFDPFPWTPETAFLRYPPRRGKPKPESFCAGACSAHLAAVEAPPHRKRHVWDMRGA